MQQMQSGILLYGAVHGDYMMMASSNKKNTMVKHWFVDIGTPQISINTSMMMTLIELTYSSVKEFIALDGGVKIRYDNSYVYDCNVLVIDNDKCYDKYGKEYC